MSRGLAGDVPARCGESLVTGAVADGHSKVWRFVKRHPWATGYVIVMTAMAGAFFLGGDMDWPDAAGIALVWVEIPVIFPVYLTVLLVSGVTHSAPSVLLVWSFILLFAVSEAALGAWLWAVAHRPVRMT